MAKATPIEGKVRVEFAPEDLRLIRAFVRATERLADQGAEKNRESRGAEVLPTETRADKLNLELPHKRNYVSCGATVVNTATKFSGCVLPELHGGMFHIDWDGVSSNK